MLVLDGDSAVGGTWSRTRVYPTLRTHNSAGGFAFSDLPIPHNRVNKWGYMGGETITEYFEEFCEKFLKDKVHLSTWVEKVWREQDGQKLYVIETKGKFTQYKTRRILFAMGTTSSPNIPDIPTDKFTKPVWHSKQLATPEVQKAFSEDSPIETVTVVGGGRSSYDMTFAALKGGKKVNWIIRKGGFGPICLFPGIVFGMNAFTMSHTQSHAVFNPNPYTLEEHSFLRNNSFGQWLFKWRNGLAESKAADNSRYNKSDLGRKLHPNLQKEFAFYNGGAVAIDSEPETIPLIHESGRCQVFREDIEKLEGDTIFFKSGKKVQTDALMWATGFKPPIIDPLLGIFPDAPHELGFPLPLSKVPQDIIKRHTGQKAAAEERLFKHFPYLKDAPTVELIAVKDKTQFGHYLHMVPPIPASRGDNTIVFLGYVELGSAAIALEIQAVWAAMYLSGHTKLPSLEEMEKKIAEDIVWSEKRYMNMHFPCKAFDHLAVSLLYEQIMGDD